jgi:transketolase
MNINDKARDLRQKFIKTAALTEATHVASCLSCIDIITALYFGGVLRYDSSNPQIPYRDRFVLSKGHAGMALYNTLCEAGFFTREQLHTYCKPGSIFGTHPSPVIPGIECVTGALGHGLSFGVGLALSARMKNENWLTYVLTGDGECNEGSIWEAAMSIAHFNLSNLIWIIDYNKYQLTGQTGHVMKMEPIGDKLSAFGFDIISADGHNVNELVSVLKMDRDKLPLKPVVIIANTIKGKGTVLLENKQDSHIKMLNKEEYKTVMHEFGLTDDEQEPL